MKKRIHIYELIFIFLLGSLIYSLIEIIYRGYTHWTMTILGGISGAVLYCISADNEPLIFKAISGALMITAFEMITGVADNIILGWSVWDYSNIPLNLFGQICLPFSIMWFLISLPAIFICRAVRKRFALFQSNLCFLRKWMLQKFELQQPFCCFHLQDKHIVPWQGTLYTLNDKKVKVRGRRAVELAPARYLFLVLTSSISFSTSSS